MNGYISVVMLCAVISAGDYCVVQSAPQWFATEEACETHNDMAGPNLQQVLKTQGHEVQWMETGCLEIDRTYASQN